MMSKKVDAIIQARLGSTRLPKKVLSDLNGQRLLDYVLDRLRASKYINRIIIATTDDITDSELVNYCRQEKILYYCGDTHNILSRFIATCDAYNCDKILRVCSDNPFIDSEAMDFQIRTFLSEEELDYCTYVTGAGQPVILTSLGLFVEATTAKALKKVAKLASAQKHYEHVTMFMYEHPEYFRINRIYLDKNIDAHYRFTVDYPQDIEFCTKIMNLTQDYSMKSLLTLMSTYRDLGKQNLDFSKSHLKSY